MIFSFEGYRLTEAPLDLCHGRERIPLTPQQGNLLLLLIRNAGRIVTRSKIRESLWSGDTHVDFDRNINVTIRQLRRALNDEADAPAFIETLRGEGYRFVAQVGESPEPAPVESPRSPTRRAPAWTTALVLGVVLAGTAVLWRSVKAAWPAAPAQTAIDASFAETYLDAVVLANGDGEKNRERSLEKLRLVLQSNPGFLQGHKARTQLLYEARWSPQPAHSLFRELETSALATLELDSDQPEALHARGYSEFRYHLDFAAAERFFQAALDLDPALTQAHHDYGLVLFAQERFQRGSEHLQAALRLSETPRLVRVDFAYGALLEGHPERALSALETLPQPHGIFATTLSVAAWLAVGDEPRALEEANSLLRFYERSDVDTLAAWYSTTIETMHRWEKLGYRWKSEIAAFEEHLGNRDRALEMLAEACTERSGWSLPFVPVDPRFADLRADPAFAPIARCLGVEG